MGWIMTYRHLFPAALTALLLCLHATARAEPLVPVAPSAVTRGTPNGAVELDRDGDGKIDYRVVYDQSGLVSREELDFNNDGRMDTFYSYKAGVLDKVEIDSKNNGTIDIRVYLLNGTYVQRYERDTDGDGKPDLVRTFNGG
jgi:hypothetical protein